MTQKLLVALLVLLMATPVLAAPLELPGSASGAGGRDDAGSPSLLAPSSQECGPTSPAPCPTPGEAKDGPSDLSSSASASSTLPAGSPAKAFKLQDLDGKAFAFDARALDKPTLVIFWSLFCAPCKEEFPMYGELMDRYGPKGLEVLTVNVDGPGMAKTAKNFLKMQGLSLRVVMDRKEGKHFLSADAYGVTGTPSLFLIDRAGMVRWKQAGRVELEVIESAVRQVLGM